MICEHCGEVVKWGWRHNQPGWWHRADPDHSSTSPRVAPVEEKAEPLPPVEVWAHDVDPASFTPQSGIRQIANLVSGITRVTPAGKSSTSKKHPAAAPGWELVNLHHARGPYVGSKGELLSVSDTHVLRARGPVELDGSRKIAVASWRDGKFDFAFIGTIVGGRLSPIKVSSDEMKGWIKGLYEPPNPSYSTD